MALHRAVALCWREIVARDFHCTCRKIACGLTPGRMCFAELNLGIRRCDRGQTHMLHLQGWKRDVRVRDR